MSQQSTRHRIVTTAERPDLIDTVAPWIWDAFWKENDYTLPQTRALVEAATASVGPPQCMVLLIDEVPVGTAGLVENDLDTRPDLTPWLAAVYVRPQSRRNGYALQLVRAIEAAAVAAGFDRLWLYTFTAEGLYRKAGWTAIETFERHNSQAVLMRRDFDRSSPPA